MTEISKGENANGGSRKAGPGGPARARVPALRRAWERDMIPVSRNHYAGSVHKLQARG
jgi:hypothetical protein